jgi:hypothetical protein
VAELKRVAPWRRRRAVRQPWCGGMRGGGGGAAGSGEGGRKGKGAWCGLVGRPGPKGWMTIGLFGPKVEGKIISE